MLQFVFDSQLNDNQIGDFVCYLQATEPLRPKGIVSECVSVFEKTRAPSVFAAYSYHKNFWIEDSVGCFIPISPAEEREKPRQSKRPVFREDTGLCSIISCKLIKSGDRVSSDSVCVPYTSVASVVDIHHKFDLQLAEYIWRNSGEVFE